MVLDQVELAVVAVRVADLDRAVAWYADKLGMTPLHRGADGDTPPYAVYDVGGMVITVWQLWPGQRRSADENDRNSYLILVSAGDVDALHDRLVATGVRADPVRHSANNTFFWFYDLDDNRWEVSQPTTAEQRAAADEILAR